MSAISSLNAQEAPFLAEIRKAPDDDLPRLVFADWLEERGDIRGEMLRVGCALARLELDDPQYEGLKAREAELLEPCLREWTARLPQVEGVTFDSGSPFEFVWRKEEWHIPFARGLLEAISVRSSEGLAACRSLFESTFVRKVQLCELHPDSALEAQPWWDRVSTLVWESVAAEPEALLASKQLAPLRQLAYVTNQAADEAARVLVRNAALTQLQDLALMIRLNDDTFVALGDWPHAPFRHLSLTDVGHETTSAAVARFLVSPVASKLESLQLSHVEFGPAAHAVLGSTNLRTLRRLRLFSAGLQRAASYVLPSLVGLRKLEWLALDHNRLGDGVLEDMAPELSPGLRRLDLEGNRLGKRAGAILAGANLANLRRLRLTDNQLNDEAAIQLAASPQFSGLIELDLFRNQIGDKGAIALAESPHLTSLKKLDLFNNPIKRAYTRQLLTERFGTGISLSPG